MYTLKAQYNETRINENVYNNVYKIIWMYVCTVRVSI